MLLDYTMSNQLETIPDYHQMHQNYLHMDFQVYGMKGGLQIPKEEYKTSHHYQFLSES